MAAVRPQLVLLIQPLVDPLTGREVPPWLLSEVERSAVDHLPPARVIRLPVLPMPRSAFVADRGQYLSSLLLNYVGRRLWELNGEEDLVMGRLAGHPRSRLIALAPADAFERGLNFVFGQAELGGPAGVVYLDRLRGDPETWTSRVVKEVLHELGHTLGLGHCENPRCVMSFSNSVREVDLKGPGYCDGCFRAITSALAPLPPLILE